jgi:large subunit ribosomal protein L24
MRTNSTQPRRQRKAVFTADLFHRRRRMALPLSRELRARYGRRQVPVRKGDTVRVLSGSYVGREERVAKIDLQHYRVTLDNITLKKADAKLKPLSLAPSHLLLTRLNLADPWRRRILKVPETEAPAEEAEGEPVGEAASTAPAAEKPTEKVEAPKPKRRAKPKAEGKDA